MVNIDHPPSELKDRWKVVEKMAMIPQYAFAGDYTVEAIEKGVEEVAKFDAGVLLFHHGGEALLTRDIQTTGL